MRKIIFLIAISFCVIASSFQISLAVQGTLQQTESFEGSGQPSGFSSSQTSVGGQGAPTSSVNWDATDQVQHGSQSVKINAQASQCEDCNNHVERKVEYTYNFEGLGSITFYWKGTDDSSSYMTAKFFIDGVQQAVKENAGNFGYEYKEFDVNAGSHTFKWTWRGIGESSCSETCTYFGYNKDFWIDNVQIYDTVSTPPTPPQNLQANTISIEQINLQWTAPSSNGGEPITGYKIERAIGNGAFSTLINNTGTTATAYSNTGLQHNTLHKYKLYAWNIKGLSNSSNTAEATTNYNGGLFDCFFTRLSNYTQIHIEAYSNDQPFNATFKVLDQFQNQQLVNFTNVNAVNQTYSVNANSTLYLYGYYNPTNLLEYDCYYTSFRNPQTIGNFSVFSEFIIFGVPAAVLFPIYVAGSISPRKAGAGLIVVGATMAIMAAMNFFTINPLAWVLIILNIALGVFVGRRAD